MTDQELNELIGKHDAKQTELTTELERVQEGASTLISGTAEGKALATKLKDLTEECSRLKGKCDRAIVLKSAREAADAHKQAKEHYKNWQEEIPHPMTFGATGGGNDGLGPYDAGKAFVESEQFKSFDPKSQSSSAPFIIEGKGLGQLIRKALLTTDTGFPPEVTRTGRVVEMIHRPVQLWNMMPQIPTMQEAVRYMEQTVRTAPTAADAAVAEGTTYSQGNLRWVPRTVDVEEYGQYIPVTKIQLADVPGIQAMINRNLTNLLSELIDSELVNGSGADERITGLLNTTGIGNIAKPADENILIGLANGLRTASGSDGRNGVPNMILLNGDDYWDMRILQNKVGDFLLRNLGEGNVPDQRMLRPFGVPCYMMGALPRGTGLTGDFMTYCHIRDRQEMMVQFTDRFAVVTEGGRDLTAPTGQMYMVANVRFALVVERPAAFAQITGLNN